MFRSFGGNFQSSLPGLTHGCPARFMNGWRIEPVTEPHAPPPPLAGEGREGASGRTTGPEAEPRKLSWRVNSKMRVRARSLRQDMTKAERVTCYAVRAHRL